jgi:hypothetical protein
VIERPELLRIDSLSGGADAVGFHFPAIDFKFQNTGPATAFMWQFDANVRRADVNPAPDLSFEASVDAKNAVVITATNNGWGTAHECQIQINSPLLNALFEKAILQYHGDIPNGATRTIIRLTVELARPDALPAAFAPPLDSHRQHVQGGGSKPTNRFVPDEHREPLSRVAVTNLHASWTCRDDNDEASKGVAEVLSAPGGCEIWLEPEGFLAGSRSMLAGLNNASPAFSGGIYIAIIDPARGPHRRHYPLSRKIAPGDIERFHIMIGALRSCRLTLQFSFRIDKRKVVTSDEFDVDIWNPWRSGWEQIYHDGDELLPRIARLEVAARRGEGDWREHQNLTRQAATYPFQNNPGATTPISPSAG